jgi:uncharacterized cofD-like protein
MAKNLKNKRVVCLGGGNAMPKVVLSGLKKYPIKISAICAMLDSGGSAGRLRRDYKISSPGDIRRAFIALANTSPIIESLFNYRFESGELKGHSFANLLITALELVSKDYKKSAKIINKMLNISHEVLPATLSNSNLCAILENGKIIVGERNIDKPKHDGNLKIKKVFLSPKAIAYPPSLQAIERADLVVIGPGDLYSSLAQIFLTKGIKESIKKSKAKKVYLCNIMTKYGETNNFTVLDFVNEVEKYLKTKLDYVVYNTKMPSKKRLEEYKREHKELIDLVKFENYNDPRFIGKDLLLEKGPVEHSPLKVAETIISLL